MEKKTINIGEHSFEMVVTSEVDGYFTTSRTYDLYFKSRRIAKDVQSIKSCYLVAFEFVQRFR